MPGDYLEIRRMLTDSTLIGDRKLQQLFSECLFELAHRQDSAEDRTRRNLVSNKDKLCLIDAYGSFYEHLAVEYLGRPDGVLFYDPLPQDTVGEGDAASVPVEKVVPFFAALFARYHKESERKLQELEEKLEGLRSISQDR